MFGLGGGELLIILLIVIIIFGVGKVSHVGKALGTAISDFRSAVKEPDRTKSIEEPKNGTDESPKA